MSIKNQSGYVMIVAMIILFAILTIGFSLSSRSSSLQSLQENAKKKIQSFYASDGQMTLLAQEIIDGNANKYRSKNYLIYDDFCRSNSSTLDSGWVEPSNTTTNKTEVYSELALFTSDGTAAMRPLMRKSFDEQAADTLLWQFNLQWGRSDTSIQNFSVFFQLGNNMSDSDSLSNVAINLRWGDNNPGGFTVFNNDVLGYLTSATAGKGLRQVSGSAHVKVIIALSDRKYNIQIDGKEYAKNIPFYSGSVSSINQMRVFTNKTTTDNLNGRSIDDVTLLIKNDNKFSSTDSSYGTFLVNWDVIEDDIGEYKLSTSSFLRDAPTVNKYRTPLNQVISNQSALSFDFPDSILVPVTFYDFHSDRTNPEFEQYRISSGSSARKGMVKTKLVDGIPARTDTAIKRMLNYYMEYWFKPDNSFPHTLIPVYTTTSAYKTNRADKDGTGGASVPADTNTVKTPTSTTTRYIDSAFSNVVIEDTLLFEDYLISGDETDDGMYTYRDSSFFPIDSKGFGIEWNRKDTTTATRNYSFTMVLKQSFVKVAGQVFKFRGDDDVWVFVNDSLQLDLGGIRSAVSDSFYIDSIAGLTDGMVYTLKMFYCERHTEGSSILIRTNLMTPTVSAQKHRSWARNYGNVF